MKKIPTLFQRERTERGPQYVIDQVTPGCEWVLAGEGTATRKYDGTCVLIRRDGLAVRAFARREVKPGKPTPQGFVPIDHDQVTGKTVGWEPAEQSSFAKWIAEAIVNMTGPESELQGTVLLPGTHELIGPKVQQNPEGWDMHWLIPHEAAQHIDLGALPYPVNAEFFYGYVGAALRDCPYEGIVWHHPDGRMAKLKRKDFPR